MTTMLVTTTTMTGNGPGDGDDKDDGDDDYDDYVGGVEISPENAKSLQT